jgi:DNA-binding LacI/PurR family transcriptional regulator
MKWDLTVVELSSPASGLAKVAHNDRLRPDILFVIAHTRAWLDAARRAFGDLPMITLGCDSGKEDAVVEDQGGGISSLLDLALAAIGERGARSGDRNGTNETAPPRVGYLSSWREGHWNEQAREAAVRFELARRGATVAPGWKLLVPMVWDSSIPYAETDHGIYFDLEAFRRGVESSIAKAPDPVPDVLLCYNDRTAMVACDALTKLRRKIPILTGWDLNPSIWTRNDLSIYSVLPDVQGACEALLELARKRMDRPLTPMWVARISQARVGRVGGG